jgi:hypothetical protein
VDTRDIIFALFPVLLMVGLFVLAALWISRRGRGRELAHRERLAMIEKGLMPPAELYPGGPELYLGRSLEAGATTSKAASRFRSAGVMFVGLGVAVGLIIGVAARQPGIAAGIGGAIMAIGAAMIVNGVLGVRDIAGEPPSSPPPPPLPGDLHARE